MSDLPDMSDYAAFKQEVKLLSEKVNEMKAELEDIKNKFSEGASKPAKAVKKSTPKKKNNLTIPQFINVIEELIPKVDDGSITKEDYIPCPRAQKNGASADMPCCKQSTKYLDINGDHHELFDSDGKFAFELTVGNSHFLRCNQCKTKATDPTTSRAQVLISAAIKEKDDQSKGIVKNNDTDVVAEQSAKDIVNSLTGNEELVKKHLRGSPDNTIPTPSKAKNVKNSKFEDDFDGHLNKVGDLWYNCYSVEHNDQTLQLVVRHQSNTSGSPSKRSPVCIGYTRKNIKNKEDITEDITQDLLEVPEEVFKKVKKRGFKYSYEGIPVSDDKEEEVSNEDKNDIVIPSVKKEENDYDAKTDESDNDNDDSDNEYDALIDELKNS